MPLRRWAGPDAAPSVGEGRVLDREPREARRRPPDARGAAPGLLLQPGPGWAPTDGPKSRSLLQHPPPEPGRLLLRLLAWLCFWVAIKELSVTSAPS
ncbi:Translation Factor Guf1 [Manis pentadactyla]|nr:Translation Factor Guf1 [Manis pentadactyla]